MNFWTLCQPLMSTKGTLHGHSKASQANSPSCAREPQAVAKKINGYGVRSDSLERVHDSQCGKDNEVHLESQLASHLGIERQNIAPIGDKFIGDRLSGHSTLAIRLFGFNGHGGEERFPIKADQGLDQLPFSSNSDSKESRDCDQGPKDHLLYFHRPNPSFGERSKITRTQEISCPPNFTTARHGISRPHQVVESW